MANEQGRRRRRYSAEVKARILAECEVPGASVAKVAKKRIKAREQARKADKQDRQPPTDDAI